MDRGPSVRTISLARPPQLAKRNLSTISLGIPSPFRSPGSKLSRETTSRAPSIRSAAPESPSTVVTAPLRSKWTLTTATCGSWAPLLRGRYPVRTRVATTPSGSPSGRSPSPCLMCGRHTTAGSMRTVGRAESSTTARNPSGASRPGSGRTLPLRIASTSNVVALSRLASHRPIAWGFPSLP